MTAIPVCSDESIRARSNSRAGIASSTSARPLDPEVNSFASVLDHHKLSYPATTNAKSLAEKVVTACARSRKRPDLGMTVVFSTYQSLSVIHEAQTKYGMTDFDLIISDEAHRTAGAYYRQ